MNIRINIARLIVVALAALGALVGVGGASPAHAISAPSNIEVHYASSYAGVRWSGVYGASKYNVEVSKQGYYGPWRLFTTTGVGYNVAFSSHPYQSSAGAYRYRIQAVDGMGNGAWSGYNFKSAMASGTVHQSNRQAAADKGNSCLSKGFKAALVYSAAGTTVIVGTAWIPGGPVISATGVAGAVAMTSTGTYMACLVGW